MSDFRAVAGQEVPPGAEWRYTTPGGEVIWLSEETPVFSSYDERLTWRINPNPSEKDEAITRKKKTKV